MKSLKSAHPQRPSDGVVHSFILCGLKQPNFHFLLANVHISKQGNFTTQMYSMELWLVFQNLCECVLEQEEHPISTAKIIFLVLIIYDMIST